MSLNTFTPDPAPSPGTNRKPKVKLLKSDFGDGYTQASPDGLNFIKDSLTLSWDVLLPAQADAIVTFFKVTQAGGAIPFMYTVSDDTGGPVQWTCSDWSDTRGQGGIRKVTATLVQDFSIWS